MILGPHEILTSEPVNWQDPLNDNLESWLLAGVGGHSGGNTWFDLCRRADVTLTGMDPPTDWIGASGRPGGFGALDFDGTNDTAISSNKSGILDWAGNCTVALWSHRVQTGNAAAVSKFLTTGNNRCWYLLLGFNVFDMSVYTDGSSGSLVTYATTGGNAPINEWHHYAVTKTGATLVFYLDAVVVDTIGSTSDAFAGTAPYAVASRGDVDNYYQALQDDVMFWSRSLSAAEVEEVYVDSRRGHPRMSNRVSPASFAAAAAAAGGLPAGSLASMGVGI